MYKVNYNKKISPDSYEMEIEAPLAVRNALPGQFVIVMAKESSERIPLTIYDYDPEAGLLKIIYQVIGASTEELSHVKDELFSVAGPLGKPNEICANPEEFKDKKICYVAGGVGIAPVYPQVKYLKSKGINCDIIYIVIVAIGPLIMMKSVCELTKKYNKKTIVSMNPIMVDGSGMCGACRCEVDGKPKFACIHGPEFDGHQVNFDNIMKRMNTYKEEEKVKWEQMKKELSKEDNNE